MKIALASATISPGETPDPPAAVKARPVALSAQLTLATALQRILRNCLDQVTANVTGVLADDVESLHQMRVGLRRLRAALALFQRQVRLPDALRRDVDWLSAALGTARDWDVLIAGTLESVGGDSWGAQRQTLRDSAGMHAAAAHHAVRRALRSARCKRLLAALAAWISGREWGEPPDGARPGELERPVGKAMGPLLDRTRRRLRKRLRQANADDRDDRDDSDATEHLHRVRIAAKKYRYAAQFFQDLLPARALKRQLRRLAALQDALGRMNDLATADRLLALLEHDTGPCGPAATFARGYLAALVQTGHRQIKERIKHRGKLTR